KGWLVTLLTSYNLRSYRINFKLVHTNIVIRNRSSCHLRKVNFKVFFIGVFNRLLAIVSTVNSECVDFICQRVIFDKVLTKLCISMGVLFYVGMHNKPYINNYAGKYYDQAKGKLYLATTDKEEQYNFAYDFLKNNGFEYTPE